jgi:hypothetical protein
MRSTFEPLTGDDKTCLIEAMKSYSDTAKTFTQLAVAALVLPIVFARQILAVDNNKPLTADPVLLLTWLFFLLAIGFGLLYQYLAVKHLEAHFWQENWDESTWIVQNPGYVYGSMMIAFYLAAILFVVRAYLQFPK